MFGGFPCPINGEQADNELGVYGWCRRDSKDKTRVTQQASSSCPFSQKRFTDLTKVFCGWVHSWVPLEVYNYFIVSQYTAVK